MLEMATVLLACGVLIVVSFEFTSSLTKREWGENYKGLF